MKTSQKNIYNVIDQNLDVNIFKLCRQFDETVYGKILLTYNLLNKMDHLFQLLHKNFMSAIQLTCNETLINAVANKFILNENLSSNSKTDLAKINGYLDELKRKDYLDLIKVTVYFSHLILVSFLLNLTQNFKLVEVDKYKSSLIELLCNLWQMIRNYYKICIFTSNSVYYDTFNSQENTAEFNSELQKKLLGNTGCIWQEIQQKVSLFFRSMVFEHFKFDDFLDILIVINKYLYSDLLTDL